jgi:hypothetical protein
MLDPHDRMAVSAHPRLDARLSRELSHLLFGDSADVVVAEQDEVDRLFIDPAVLDVGVAPERGPRLSLVPQGARFSSSPATMKMIAAPPARAIVDHLSRGWWTFRRDIRSR